jgi:hypothetical protein
VATVELGCLLRAGSPMAAIHLGRWRAIRWLHSGAPKRRSIDCSQRLPSGISIRTKPVQRQAERNQALLYLVYSCHPVLQIVIMRADYAASKKGAPPEGGLGDLHRAFYAGYLSAP